ncbi:hypothetical protein AB205_0008630 [Aquarana catesbeiana]|uniref:Uncharacterized protein n=1 Tax=Aquarana catesbeiana TaxID=8400 RepID=A0A2G9SJS8_AQUCT|nr:hypothetical protein AB205_0008630 [Aquarana catesbeiana]
MLNLTFAITIGASVTPSSQIVHTTHACYALWTLRMRETLPASDVLSSLFPAPSHSAQWGKSTWRSQSRCLIFTPTRRRKARRQKRPDPEGDDLRHQICPLGRCWRWSNPEEGRL